MVHVKKNESDLECVELLAVRTFSHIIIRFCSASDFDVVALLALRYLGGVLLH